MLSRIEHDKSFMLRPVQKQNMLQMNDTICRRCVSGPYERMHILTVKDIASVYGIRR